MRSWCISSWLRKIDFCFSYFSSISILCHYCTLCLTLGMFFKIMHIMFLSSLQISMRCYLNVLHMHNKMLFTILQKSSTNDTV